MSIKDKINKKYKVKLFKILNKYILSYNKIKDNNYYYLGLNLY